MVACSKTFPARPIMGNSAVQGTFEEGIVTENLASFPDNSSIGQSGGIAKAGGEVALRGLGLSGKEARFS